MLSLVSLSLIELARFESGIFPYSVVTGYVENFLDPVIRRLQDEGVDPVFVVMMPQSYSDLDHKSRVLRYKQKLQEAGYSVKLRTVKTHLPRGAAIAQIFPQPSSFRNRSQTLYIDAASTVTTFRNVIDYKKQNLIYGFSSKDAMVAQYVDDFRKSVFSLITRKDDQRRIIFASSKKELFQVLDGKIDQ